MCSAGSNGPTSSSIPEAYKGPAGGVSRPVGVPPGPVWRPPTGTDRLAAVGVAVAVAGLVALDLDLLLADLLGDLALVGHGLGVEADPLLGHGPLLHHRLLLAQGDLVLLLGDGRAAGRGIQVGVGDRLALDPDLLALHRHRHLLGLGGDVLAQPGPAPLAGLGPDPQLLLGAGHGVVGGRPRGVPAHGAVLDVVVDAVAVPVGGVGGVAAVVVEAVVAPELLLLGLRQVLVGVDPGGVLDLLLVVGHLDLVAGTAGLGEGDEAGSAAEQAGVDQGPLRLAGLVIHVDGFDGADLGAVSVDHGGALPATYGIEVGHVHPPVVVAVAGAGGWGGRGSATMRQALPRADPVSAAASVGAAGTELLGGARVDDGAAALGLVGLGVLVAVGRGGRGRSPSLLAKFGATPLGPAGGSVPVALHGLDPTAADGDHGRADHDGQDRVPQAGHDPGS